MTVRCSILSMTGEGTFVWIKTPSNNRLLPFPPMADPPNTPTGRAILKAARAMLLLVSSSSELLTHSQLLAVRNELRSALAIVNGQIQVVQSGQLFCKRSHSTPNLYSTGGEKLVIDISDWEVTSDEDEEQDKSAKQEKDTPCEFTMLFRSKYGH